MARGVFGDGVTRNRLTKCWLARIRRCGKGYSRYFFDGRWGGEAEARRSALAWLSELAAQLPPPVSRKGRMTRKNKSGVVGVRLAREVQTKSSGAEYVYWCWKANWPGCPKRGGVGWRAHVHGDEDAFVLAVLTRRLEQADRERVLQALRLAKASQEYGAIVGMKKLAVPQDACAARRGGRLGGGEAEKKAAKEVGAGAVAESADGVQSGGRRTLQQPLQPAVGAAAGGQFQKGVGNRILALGGEEESAGGGRAAV